MVKYKHELVHTCMERSRTVGLKQCSKYTNMSKLSNLSSILTVSMVYFCLLLIPWAVSVVRGALLA